MEHKPISSQPIVKSQPKVKSMTIISGSAKNFKCIPEPGDHFNRPLMVNAWSQTTCNDFSYLNEIEYKGQQLEREKELKEKIRVLEENLKAHTELLSQIHATSARTSALLGQQQNHLPQCQEQKSSTTQFSSSSIKNNNNRSLQMSPEIANTSDSSPVNSVINPLQQVNCSPVDSIKYTIIAEGTGNNNGEPIEIQLAEDDGAINLNSSADSGRLEICLAPEENIEIKTEFNTSNVTTIHQTVHQSSTPSEHHFIKRRKLAVDQHEIQSNNSNYYFNDQGNLSPANVQNKTPAQRRRSSNSLLKSSKIENNNHSGSVMQTIDTSPNNSTTLHSGNSNGRIGVDTDNVMVSIGPNNTRIPAKLYENMNWNSASIATRKLLMAIFDRKTLATHSMTGKPSPAFKDHGKPLKQMLDPLVIADIIFAVTRKCNVSDKEVRNAITTKCADENKMMKLQMNKRTPMREMNKENIV